ncbi:hypothetical protein QP365_11370 [Corynebacterium aurimucosum]|nr:hypothetical protein [Corynebacterium aurimucosum]
MRFNACCHRSTNTVIVRTGLDPATRACAIAAELGVTPRLLTI